MQQGVSGLGERLQHAREARGLSIADVAGTTRMSERAILAIDRERFHLLPGGIFRRTYIRSYAEAVGLDGAACVRSYVQHFETSETANDGGTGDWPRPALAIAVATLLALILGLAVIAFAEA